MRAGRRAGRSAGRGGVRDPAAPSARRRDRAHLRRRPASRGDAGGARTARARRREGDLLPRRRAGRAPPALAAEIAAAGHEVGIHGYRHTLLLRRTPRSFATTSTAPRTSIGEATGQASLSYRPPYGVFSLAGLRLARERWSAAALVALGPRLGGEGDAVVDRGPRHARASARAPCDPAPRQRRLQRRRVVASDGRGAAGRARRGGSRPASRSSRRASRRSGGRRRGSSCCGRQPSSRRRALARGPPELEVGGAVRARARSARPRRAPARCRRSPAR